MKYSRLHIFWIFMLLSGCGAYFNQPLDIQKATIGEETQVTPSLRNLPLPKDPIVVGVYKFRDQTGQYKPIENGSTFSTAVTQGGTAILLKALEDSKWFMPIERENLANLLQERNIIRSTRQEYLKNNSASEQQLAPLLYAGVLLEGGIVSYDSNIITGGFGARYFGAGGSTQYRQDRVTVYLRLISTSNGKILKTVYVSKTILSQELGVSLFRYVDFKRLLEVETGFTKNEPIQMAVTEAIEKAVEGMVLEGIRDKIWEAKETNPELEKLIDNYNKEVTIAESTELYGRYLKERRTGLGFDLAGGAAIIQGDYTSAMAKPYLRAGLRVFFIPSLGINFSANIFGLGNENKFSDTNITTDLNLEYTFLPKDKFTPFIYAGPGYGTTSEENTQYFKFQGGLGLEYLCTDKLGLKVFGEFNATQTDMLDNVAAGVRDDYYWRFGIGLNFYFNPSTPKSIPVKK